MLSQRFICFALCPTDRRSPPDSPAHLDCSAVPEAERRAVAHTCLDARVSGGMVSAEIDGR